MNHFDSDPEGKNDSTQPAFNFEHTKHIKFFSSIEIMNNFFNLDQLHYTLHFPYEPLVRDAGQGSLIYHVNLPTCP